MSILTTYWLQGDVVVFPTLVCLSPHSECGLTHQLSASEHKHFHIQIPSPEPSLSSRSALPTAGEHFPWLTCHVKARNHCLHSPPHPDTCLPSVCVFHFSHHSCLCISTSDFCFLHSRLSLHLANSPIKMFVTFPSFPLSLLNVVI